MDNLTVQAAKHATDIIRLAIKLPPERKALLVFDLRTPLARIVAAAYQTALPQATTIEFESTTPEAILAAINTLAAGDLVVLVQSSSFMLAAFRFRIELFQRGIAVIEHVHLERATDDKQMAIYVDAMAYDAANYARLGHGLKAIVDAADTVIVRCPGTELRYEGGMESAKLNIGDYTGMKNIGGTFPIGEVFSEPKDLARVNGEAKLFAFAGFDHVVRLHAPFKIKIEQGILVAHEGPPEFQVVLDQITTEEKVLVREFGLGLNPAMDRDRVLDDITAFERQKGLHFSLGEKHPVYRKPGFNPKKTHFHIDVFVDVERIEVDGRTIYADDDFIV